MLTTLAQRLYLISYTVEKQKFEVHNLQFRGQRLRAAALVDLTGAGLITLLPGKKEKVVRTGTTPPDDSFLAEIWHEVPPEDPRGWLDLIHARAHTAESAVRTQLDAIGEITIRDDNRKKLAMLSQHQVTVNHPEHVLALQERAREPILRGLDPAGLPLHDLAMTVLATEADYAHHIFGRADARTHKKAIRAYGEYFDKTIPGLRKAVQTSMAVLRPSGGGWGS